jgi:hypothetical protein
MLSYHPANLLLRFALEVVSLVSVGQWAARFGESFGPAGRWALGIGVPLVMAVGWAIFRANEPALPGAPSNPKHPIVRVSGRARLALELAFFFAAALALFAMGNIALGIAYLFAQLLHHFWSVDRVVHLARNR